MGKRLVTVKCNMCGCVFRRNLDEKYINPNGTPKSSSRCKDCTSKKRASSYSGRKSVDMMAERDPESFGVRHLSREEIEACNYTPPRKIKPERLFLTK